MPIPQGDITRQLRRWREGDGGAIDELTPLVYDHLRMLAGTFLNGQGANRPLQPTELVDELFVELLKAHKVDINDRNHFFAFSARVMRQILIHSARKAQAEKRGGGLAHLPLNEELHWTAVNGNHPGALDLESALNELEQLDEPAVRAVELRYIFGFTAEETAELLGSSKASVDRHVRFALTWLHSRLHPEV